MKILIGLFFASIFILLFSVAALSQNKPDAQTIPPVNARFEIIKSPKINSTFRLDRFSGKIYQLFIPEGNSRMSWMEMKIEELPKSITAKPIFQIFMSENDRGKHFY